MKNHIVRMLLLISFATFFFNPITIFASTDYTLPFREKIYLEDGYYIETYIENVSNRVSANVLSLSSNSNTITKTKTTNYKDPSGKILWSVSITATFSYNGSTSRCTQYYHRASAPSTSWFIKSVSSSKSGNTATAVAIATHYNVNWSEDITKSVTIKCSKTGVIS